MSDDPIVKAASRSRPGRGSRACERAKPVLAHRRTCGHADVVMGRGYRTCHYWSNMLPCVCWRLERKRLHLSVYFKFVSIYSIYTHTYMHTLTHVHLYPSVYIYIHIYIQV